MNFGIWLATADELHVAECVAAESGVETDADACWAVKPVDA